MATTFKNYGVPAGFSSDSRLANPALLAAQTPPYGGFKKVSVTAAIAQHSLIKADGTLATDIEAAVGVTRDEITAQMITDAGGSVDCLYATSGNFLFEALNVDASITTAEEAQGVVDAGGGDNIIISSNKYAGV